MNVVILRVLERRDVDGVEWWLATPALAPEEHVVIWRGIAPPPMPDNSAVAPVVLVGEVDGRVGYAERVPRGILWSDADLPPGLASWVSFRLLSSLMAMHRAGVVHGSVGTDRVFLGEDGSVVTFGWGRRGSTQAADLAMVPIPTADPPSDAPARLGEWVRAHLAAPSLTEDTVALVVRPDSASDEVVPDIGPDASAGILDRWSVNTATDRPEELTPAAVGAGALTGGDRFAVDTWAMLDRALPVGPAGRFLGVEAGAARAIRALLADEPPEILPGVRQQRVGPFLGVTIGGDEHTIVAFAPTGDLTAAGERTHTEGFGPGVRRAGELVLATLIGAGIAGLLLRAC